MARSAFTGKIEVNKIGPDTPLRLNVATAIAWRRPTEAAEIAFRDAVDATGGLLRLLQGSVQ